MKLVLPFVLPFVLSLFVSFSCTKKMNPNEIRIGQFASMTGSEATFGISTDEGIRLFLDEVNQKGGVKGKKIKLITMDNQGKPEEAAAVATRLIEQEKVLALLGEVASSRSLAAAPIAQLKKIPMISPSSTNPKVTEVGDYIFRVCFIDPFQGRVMARFANENLKLKKVAILRDLKSDYSIGLADFFVATHKEYGGSVVADLSYQSGDVDFKAQLTQIKSQLPDALYIPGYYTEVGLIARQAREVALKAVLMGGDGWDSEKLFEIGGESIEGAYFSNHYSNESTLPEVINFVQAYKSKYQKAPDGLAAQGYDAAGVLVKAISEAKDFTTKSIREELAKIKNYQGVTGMITIDQNRNAMKSAVVVQVSGKINKYVTTINP